MSFLASITHSLTTSVATHGVAAVFVLMAVDALLPLGGELIMVVAGAIAAKAISGHPSLLGHDLHFGLQTYLVLASSGTLGYFAGSATGWLIGRRVGADRLERHGHLVHLGPATVIRAERWFARHGALAVFLGRLTPLVRSFISIPAGLFGEPLLRYLVLTLAASAIWCFGFAGLGWGLGTGYRSVDHATHIVEALLLVGAAALLATVAWRRGRASVDQDRL